MRGSLALAATAVKMPVLSTVATVAIAGSSDKKVNVAATTVEPTRAVGKSWP